MQPTLEIIDGTATASLNARREPLINKRPYWHYHPEIELTFMASGQARMQVGNHVATCKAGDLIVLGPDLPHDFNPVEADIECDFYVMQFRQELLAPFPEMGGALTFLERAVGGLLLEDTPAPIVDRFAAIDASDPSRRLAMLLEMLIDLSDVGSAAWQPLSPVAIVRQVAEGRNHQRMHDVIEFVLGNVDRQISLDEISRVVHMAPPSFSRWFKRTMRMTFTQYVNRIRIEESCRQLRSAEKPITVIARDCGYESFSSFNRQFRRQKGCSPSEWRRGKASERGLFIAG